MEDSDVAHRLPHQKEAGQSLFLLQSSDRSFYLFCSQSLNNTLLFYQHLPQLALGHAHGLNHDKLFFTGNNGRNHRIDKVKHTHQSNNHADGISHNFRRPCFCLILLHHGFSGCHRQTGVNGLCIRIQHFLYCGNMFIIHMEEQSPHRILRPLLLEYRSRNNKAHAVLILYTAFISS